MSPRWVSSFENENKNVVDFRGQDSDILTRSRDTVPQASGACRKFDPKFPAVAVLGSRSGGMIRSWQICDHRAPASDICSRAAIMVHPKRCLSPIRRVCPSMATLELRTFAILLRGRGATRNERRAPLRTSHSPTGARTVFLSRSCGLRATDRGVWGGLAS